MFQILILICLGLKNLTGGIGSRTNAMQSLSVTEGDSITLHTNVTELRKGEITWKFGSENSVIALIHTTYLAFYTYDGHDGRFRNRLKLDNQTGSLTITNIGSEHAGLYKVEIFAAEQTTKTFSVSVYAHLPNPNITRGDSQTSSSSSSQSNCSVVCSVVNVSAVSLSWYKGNSLLSSITVSDLSTSLSLPLEVGYQVNNTYSCVINNTISNHTTHLDFNTLCLKGQGLPVFNIVFTAAAGSLMIVVAVVTCFICKKWRKTGQASKHSTLCEPKTRRAKSKTEAFYENVPKKR